jgi:hypothetical protein
MAGMLTAVAFALAGCQGETFDDAIPTSDGGYVRLNEVAAIVQNPDLDVFQMDEQLEALGIEDPLLRQQFIEDPDSYFPPG